MDTKKMGGLGEILHPHLPEFTAFQVYVHCLLGSVTNGDATGHLLVPKTFGCSCENPYHLLTHWVPEDEQYA